MVEYAAPNYMSRAINARYFLKRSEGGFSQAHILDIMSEDEPCKYIIGWQVWDGVRSSNQLAIKQIDKSQCRWYYILDLDTLTATQYSNISYIIDKCWDHIDHTHANIETLLAEER